MILLTPRHAFYSVSITFEFSLCRTFYSFNCILHFTFQHL